MKIIVFDRDENRLADLNPEAIKAPSDIEDTEGVMTFSFQYAITEEDVSSLEGGNFVAFLDELENIWKEYEIIDTKEGTQFLSVSCEHRYYGLANEELVTWNTNADNASIAMGYTLQKTRWQVGIVQNTRALKRDVFEKNPLEALRFIEKEWGGVLRFRVEITGSGDHAFFVDLLERRGSVTGLRFEFGHNLKDFEHTVSFGLVKTALYGRGQGQSIPNATSTAALTFADIAWSKANGDPTDKPLGQDWVGFEDKRLIYGAPDGNGGRKHLFGTYNSQAQTPDGLLWETYFKLLDASEPLLNVRASVIDLEKYSPDFSHETVRLGDTSFLVAIYENRNIALTADILRIERNPDDFSATVVELGNYLPVYSKRLNDIEKNVNLQQARAGIYERAGALNPDGTVPTSILSGVIDAVQNEFHSSVGFTYQTAEGILVLNDDRDTGNPTKAMLISGGSFFLANAKNPDGSWKWRTFGNGDGFIADEIISGSIKTDLVEVFGSANFKWNGDNIYITNPADARQQIRIGKYDGANYGIAFTTDGGNSWQNSLDFNGLHISYTKVEGLSTQLSGIDTKATNAQTAANAAQTTANSATTAASNAQSTADSATTAASNAQAAASAAQSAANTAQAAADTAKQTADSAATAASAAQSTANAAQTAANTANNLLSDLASDNKLTANEKQSVKKEWDSIVAEKPTIDGQATTYGITTEKTNYDNSYNTLSTYITPLLADLTTTSDIVGTTFRTNFKDYYDKRTILLKAVTDAANTKAANAASAASAAQTSANNAATAASNAQSAADSAATAASNAQTSANNAQGTADSAASAAAAAQSAADAANSAATAAQTAASNAQTSANNALNTLSDIANDNKFTPSEKQDTQKEWNIIQGEKANIDAQATTYAITTEKTTYDNAYTSLSNYISPLLTDLTTTSDITGTTFRTNFKTYYDARTSLLKKITDTAKSLADTAQTAANTAKTAADNAQTSANNAATAASNAQSTADTAKTNAATAQTAADNAASAAAAAQSTANTAATNASSALSTLSDIANDNKLTPSEKQDTKKEWDIIGGEKANIDAQATTYGITTEKTTYDNAYSTLSTYITPLLTDLTTTSDIVGTTFRSNFKAYYDARTALLKKISDTAKTLADNAQSTANSANTAAANAQTAANNAQSTANTAATNASTALTTLSDIASDNKFSPSEKQATKKEWDIIASEKANIDAQATTYNITTEKTTYDNAYSTLSTYITPLLTDLTTTSDIVGTDFRTNFKTYYDARTALLKKITDTAKSIADAAQTSANNAATAASNAQSTANTASTNASTALTTLSDIANDNKFSPSEKQATKKEWDIIGGEKANIDAQATTYGITTEKTTYDNAYSSLSTYITPLLTDLTTTSDIVGTTFRTNFKTYYDARTALLKKITDQAKSLADAAQTTANSANTAAGNAQTTANNANTAAGNAQTSANNAQSTANAANSAAAVARTIAENVVIKPVFAKDFLDGMLDGITIGGGTAVVTDMATMQVTGTTGDVTITMTPPANFDGGQNEKVALRVRYIADQSTTNLPTWQGQIYYSTANETSPAYTGHGASESFTYKNIPQPAKDGSWTYILADMHSLTVGGTDWKDHNIISIRLDLWSYAIFEVQFITIGTVSPNLATPEDVDIVASDVNSIKLDITADKILQKLSSNTSFTQLMDGKADATDLGSYVSNEDLSAYKTDVTKEIGDAITAQDFSDFVKSAELTQEVNAINAKFESGGGVNMVKNSTGLSNFDFWTTSYATRMAIITNADLEKMGFVAGFQFPPLAIGSARYIVQTVPVKIGKSHTVSWFVNKKNASPAGNNDGAFVVQILNPDGTGLSGASKWYNSEVVTNGYESGSFTFVPLTDTIQIRVYGYGLADAIIAGLMMNLGTNAFQWTMANGELYNTNVGFDLNGIRVSQMTNGKESARTVMTPTKFAGYYDVNGDGVIDVGTGSLDEVFRMDKDEFVMKKAVVREVMTLGKVKLIMVDGGGNTGIAFVPNN